MRSIICNVMYIKGGGGRGEESKKSAKKGKTFFHQCVLSTGLLNFRFNYDNNNIDKIDDISN